MTLKILGAIFVIVGCGGFGLLIAASHRREERSLRQFISILDYMEWELQCRLTPLPELCRRAAITAHGSVKNVFIALANELDNQISPDASQCMSAAMLQVRDMPKLTKNAMELLGRSLGRFDMDGQLKAIDSVRTESCRMLNNYTKDQDVRLRSYQTLGLCAGAAMAIILI